ncbi:uncharacterized protein N7483_001535 [Penicillium malachiteum]|uniref:uncharacterized protein n=1 Tax=Penicillium malachiteum TaxID=1324776 RepID=UPI0025469241|nr:uncharacterized protein N7483_001535 [Penicillium malachiteum]KAJ5736410.1 hypothetical protein N7483_001535 [Penicillium malachiteum]
MDINTLPGNPLPNNKSPEVTHYEMLSSMPSIFILPTHMPLHILHESEAKLVKYGGSLTYDIGEAGLILGKVSHKKRAVLELRSRGLWTEEILEIGKFPKTTSDSHPEIPSKRQKLSHEQSAGNASSEIVDLCTDSEEEGNSEVKAQIDPSEAILSTTVDIGHKVTVLRLDWLVQSIKNGEPLPMSPFLVYHGRKIAAPLATPSQPVTIVADQIKQRAIEDAAKRPAIEKQTIHPRRSRQDPEKHSSQRHPPVLYRETTSENDDTTPLPPQPDWVRDHVVYACMRSAPLHPPNEEFILQLLKIRRIRQFTLDDIGVRAYSTFIAAMAAYPYLVKRSSEITALPGCDVKLANLFAEFQHHKSSTNEEGFVSAAQALETDPILRILTIFNDIWGVGPKTARDFYYSRGWRDLDDIVEFGWNSLSRVQQIGVKFYDELQQGVSRMESESIAGIVRQHANAVRPDADQPIGAILVGGYRRGKESSGDVDLILTHRDESVTRNLVVDIVASLEKAHYITHTLSLHVASTHREQQTRPFSAEDGHHFDTLDKALVVWQDPNFENSEDHDPSDSTEGASNHKKNPNPHRRVDIVISPWRTIGCAVLGWTGDTTFQRDLRRYAKKAHDWKFDSSGIRERTTGGQVVDLEHDGDTWQQREKLVMERLGIGWRPPEQRCSR